MSSADEDDAEDSSVSGKRMLVFSCISRWFLTDVTVCVLLQNKEIHFRQLNFKDGYGTQLGDKMDLL